MIKNVIDNYVETTQNNLDKYLIIMVSNVKGLTTSFKDYSETSVMSEYYSLLQYEQISTTIKSIGFELKCYFDENDFIHDFENGILRDNYPKKIIVLNSAQKGTTPGRKSLVPAFCALNNILFSNSNAYVTSFVRNKFHWNSFLSQGEYTLCKNWLYDYRYGWIFNKKPESNEKVICKLNSESSSIGLGQKNIFHFSEDKENFIDKLSRQFNQKVIVQQFISGKEVEVPVLSTPEQTVSFNPVGISVNNKESLDNTILDYNIRGNNKFNFYNFDNKNPILSKKIKTTTELVAQDLEIFGYGRIDYRIDDNNNFYITDIATNPHITKSMSYYYAFKELGYSYEEVLKSLFGLIITHQQR
ncbi:hypothetical protein [Enterococcus sp. CWB-B31]|uniref:hypothetical protein n=1 Tax=Enterococcus sp. CWB-B31 TaxID=2885159 RepID=UPI001E619A1F|nr:hypothetical protein [Enterococcus sp. CWB-B31]MCB5954928.1 hypothetical protein [Enterococcus sp. CWB-B31]